VLKIHLAICLASVDVAPFWRLTDPDSKVAARLTVDSEWIAAQLTPNPIVYVEIPVTDHARASKASSYAIRAAAEESCWRQRLLSAFAQRSVRKPVDYPQRSQTHNQA
jgi:hypothetical protein